MDFGLRCRLPSEGAGHLFPAIELLTSLPCTEYINANLICRVLPVTGIARRINADVLVERDVNYRCQR